MLGGALAIAILVGFIILPVLLIPPADMPIGGYDAPQYNGRDGVPSYPKGGVYDSRRSFASPSFDDVGDAGNVDDVYSVGADGGGCVGEECATGFQGGSQPGPKTAGRPPVTGGPAQPARPRRQYQFQQFDHLSGSGPGYRRHRVNDIRQLPQHLTVEALDQNSDGSLDLGDLQTGCDVLTAEWDMALECATTPQLLDGADINGDGQLGAQEWRLFVFDNVVWPAVAIAVGMLAVSRLATSLLVQNVVLGVLGLGLVVNAVWSAASVIRGGMLLLLQAPIVWATIVAVVRLQGRIVVRSMKPPAAVAGPGSTSDDGGAVDGPPSKPGAGDAAEQDSSPSALVVMLAGVVNCVQWLVDVAVVLARAVWSAGIWFTSGRRRSSQR